MPAILTLTVTSATRPQPTAGDLHRLACYLLEERAPGVHHRQRKAFSVWPLLPSPAGPPQAVVRLNLFADTVTGADRRRIVGRIDRGLQLGKASLQVQSVDLSPRSFADLASAPAHPVADLVFRSPVYFSRSGRDYLLPDPELVVRSTVARWNEFAPGALSISEAAARSLGQQVVLFAHRLETVRIETHAGSRRTGFLGWARLGLPRAVRRTADGQTAARTLGRLLALLPYCGLGAQTTHGLGALEVQAADG